MGLDLLLLALGIALLLGGGEAVVRGATGLARALGVSPLAIGLTVVSFGTSAPELAVNVIAAWDDRGGICFGNIMGSNLANIGLIVGCAALLRPIGIHGIVVRRELPMMLLTTAAALAMGFDRLLGAGPDQYDRADGLVFLLLFLVFLFYTIGDFVRQRGHALAAAGVDGTQTRDSSGLGRHLVVTAGGLAALVGGAKLAVGSAVGLARAFDVAEEIIGLTLLAVGTSLPELVASVVATMRKQAELAIGNVVGSNIFNLALVGGVTSIVRPIPVPAGGWLDLAAVAALSTALFFAATTQGRTIIRTQAAALLTAYVGYVTWRALAL